MKNALALVGFLLLTAFTQPVLEVETLDIQKALSLEKIDLKIIGNTESTHYYKPLLIELKNTANHALEIKIANGQLFKSADPEAQDIITTQEEIIALKALESVKIPLYGMCVQEYNAAPDATTVYELGTKAKGNLATLAMRIQKEKAFGVAGQQAVWALTDGRPMSEITSMDLEQTTAARDMVMDLVAADTVTVVGETIRRPRNNGRIKRSMEGNFNYRISQKSDVHIALFNQDNIVLDELFYKAAVAPGSHSFEYTLDRMIDPKQYYYIRLIINGEIKINFEMEPRS